MIMDEKDTRRKARRLMSRHPEHLPVIIITNIKMTKYKFLPHKESTVAFLLTTLRGYMPKIKSSQGLIFTVNNTMPPLSLSIEELYKEHASPDEYLHISVTTENMFG